MALVLQPSHGFVARRRTAIRCFVATAATTTQHQQHVVVVGAGLAGLATAHYLLEKKRRVTLVDKKPIGMGGASSVAGGLLHPFSPRLKLVHLGMEGLDATNALLEKASRFEPRCIVRDRLYRVAATPQHEDACAEAALRYPMFCSGYDAATKRLELSNGCKVVDVPLYLRGLYASLVQDYNTDQFEFVQSTWEDYCRASSSTLLSFPNDNVDAIVYAGGGDMFLENILSRHAFPIELVRGQSIILDESLSSLPHRDALLCGKYLSPTAIPGRIVIGATHEYKEVPLSRDEVVAELQSRSAAFLPKDLFDNNSTAAATLVDVTSGWRVQSQRGARGRVPMVGTLHDEQKEWIFTGLSSRGLLHHAICAEFLATALCDKDESILAKHQLLWWK